MKELPIIEVNETTDFAPYVQKFKALADEQRLKIMNILTTNGRSCVCDLAEEMQLPQSKLSYHLKILWKANVITKDTEGTWSYYAINENEIDALLSEQLCCLFKPSK
ncbi:ArsR family transcriptional regulator [Pontibacillus chungwhensis BH030062]|uniref:ArsR family transcriptional regulator n=1 Tax=Pontibacillus chungwhensis BH030062 TaxID=1385513 RepID=A0A0A2USE5_9BACI|nr:MULTISPECIES: metalloregulator ArsR/SmtB family transcription factor [Pontibacillus]KGP91237.1 ArsR family transcriptional regulator [Pontibacillus chungwhensis BH030062]QST01012.1 winged helix-turn-helix transcriptional regulator [Pontibacillus sp. ALD_SL1]